MENWGENIRDGWARNSEKKQCDKQKIVQTQIPTAFMVLYSFSLFCLMTPESLWCSENRSNFPIYQVEQCARELWSLTGAGSVWAIFGLAPQLFELPALYIISTPLKLLSPSMPIFYIYSGNEKVKSAWNNWHAIKTSINCYSIYCFNTSAAPWSPGLEIRGQALCSARTHILSS